MDYTIERRKHVTLVWFENESDAVYFKLNDLNDIDKKEYKNYFVADSINPKGRMYFRVLQEKVE